MLKDAEKYIYDIIRAIQRHGTAYKTITLFDEILNCADLTTDHEGSPVLVEKRLADIKDHCGEESEHYQHAYKQADILGLIKPKNE